MNNNISPKNILIVDDDRSMRSLLTLVIEGEGYKALEAQNGKDCLIQFARQSPDLVLLDAVMPDMDGFTCCQQLRLFKNAGNVPIVMLTFLDDQESINKAFAAGVTDYFIKPIPSSILLPRLKRLIAVSDSIASLALLRRWKKTLVSLLAFLDKSPLESNELPDLISTIRDHFQVSYADYLARTQLAVDSLVVINSPAEIPACPRHVTTFLTSISAQACLLLPPLVIGESTPRQWEVREVEEFCQMQTILSHLRLQGIHGIS